MPTWYGKRAAIRRHRRAIARPCERRRPFHPPGGGFHPPGGGFISPYEGTFQEPDDYIDFDLYHPEPQSFPSSPAAAAAAGFAGTVEALWACQETSGTTLADASGNGHTLTLSDAVRCLVGQRAVGPFDGTSFVAQKCIEIQQGLTGSNKFELALSTQLDKTWTTAWSVVGMYRAERITASGGFISKGTFGAGAHWGVSINAGNGTIEARVSDGTDSVVTTTTGNMCDGAWHWFYVRWDPITDTLKVDTDLATGFSQSTALIDTAANAGKFRLGEYAGLANSNSFQLRGLIVFSDVATTVASIQAWWRHGRVPPWLTYSRASAFNRRIARDATGDVTASWSSGQVAYGYSPLASTNPLKIGLSTFVAATNLFTETDMNVAASWPVINATKTTYNKDSSLGFRSAIKAEKTGIAQSYVYRSAAVTLGTTYTFAVDYWWDGTVTAPTSKLTDDTAETTVYATGLTDLDTGGAPVGDSTWRRGYVTWTATVTATVQWHVYPSGAASTTGAAWFGCPMYNTGAYPLPFIQTAGATASTVAISARVAVSGLTSDYGTLKVWATFAGQDSASYRVLAAAVQTAGSIANERAMGISATENLWFGAGAFDFQGGNQANLPTVETVMIGWWDKAERYGWSASVARNGAAPITNVTDLAAVTPAEVLYIGQRADGTIGHDGEISKVRVWRYPEIAA